MNWLLIPTLLLSGILFGVGARLGKRRLRGGGLLALCGLGAIVALPGVLFAAYYLKGLGEPVWLYRFRSVPGAELAASGAGFLAGLLHGRLSGGERFRRIVGRWFFPGVLAVGLVLPYLKPVLRPPRSSQFQDRWVDDVCLQTSESSCGPACVATLLRRFGKHVTEAQIAKECFTSGNGTENWYLARAFRKRGLAVQLLRESDPSKPWPFPAIAGVRLRSSGNTGHFITILDRTGDNYVVGDPLEGKVVQSQSQLRETYEFTGFFMVVK
jgi:hypothetical protein